VPAIHVEPPRDVFNVIDSGSGALASSLGLPRHYIQGLAAHESGWYDDHNCGLSNPLGLTDGGKNNLAFPSIDDAFSYFKKQYGDQVQGATSPSDFTQRLRGMLNGKPVSGWHRYNTADTDWETRVRNNINSIDARRQTWWNNQNFDR
jgi:hypothetical protein